MFGQNFAPIAGGAILGGGFGGPLMRMMMGGALGYLWSQYNKKEQQAPELQEPETISQPLQLPRREETTQPRGISTPEQIFDERSYASTTVQVPRPKPDDYVFDLMDEGNSIDLFGGK